MMKGQRRIRTRYQRMLLAWELAEPLLRHPDPVVQERALEIRYAIGAPLGTLNHVLDSFPTAIVNEVLLAAETDATKNIWYSRRKSAKKLARSEN